MLLEGFRTDGRKLGRTHRMKHCSNAIEYGSNRTSDLSRSTIIREPMRFALLFASTLALHAATLDSSLFSRLEYRSIGPTSMGGRICDVAGIPGDISTVY